MRRFYIRRRRGTGTAIAACLFCLLAPGASAQAYKAETAELAPPEELSAAVRQALSLAAIRVTGPQGPLCEIWVRSAVPGGSGAADFGIAYAELAEGTLVGAVRFLAEHRDYRRQRVAPGVYTLRYGLHPVDGNHLGVAPQRDFLLLLPAAADTAVAPLPVEQRDDLSARSAGTTHPSVWSLVPPENASAPAISHHPGEDLWVLSFPVKLEAEGAEPRTATLSLVIAGHAAEA